MSDRDPYEAWKAARGDAAPGDGFAEGVMDRIRRFQAQQRPGALADLCSRLMSHWYAAAAMILLAVGLGVARFAMPLAVLLGLAQ